MKIGAIIQARTSSERLPGKVLLKLPFGSNISVLEQVVERVKCSRLVEEVIIATSDKSDDQPIVDMANRNKCAVFTGSLHNVLSRYYLSAKKFSFDVIVRITGDCPCIDPTVIDMVVEQHLNENADFTSCSIKRTFPIGIDVGIMNIKALQEAYKKASSTYDKEHVTSYFYKTNPDSFKICLVEAPDEYHNPDIRLTLDTPEDYILLCTIYDYLYSNKKFFGLGDVLSFLQSKPWLPDINKEVMQKKFHVDINSELDDVLNYCSRQELTRIYSFLKEHAHSIQKKFS